MNQKNLSVSSKSLNLFNNKIVNRKILKIFDEFESSLNLDQKFAVAISGGPDSLTLAYLSKIFSQKKKLQVKYFLVNHRLREESTKEAQNVKLLLKKHKMKLEILNWKGNKPSSNVQSKAREARYRLLFEKCKKLGVKNILLGHHLDDLLENFLIRMLRGSGLRGLVSFDKKSKYNNDINIYRPLINLEKKDLIYVAEKVFKSYISDSSNFDKKFKRTKVRKLLFDLEKEGLDKKKFFSTIQNLKSSDNAIKYYVRENLLNNSFFSKSKKIIILNNSFFKNSYEIIFRSLSECIKKIGGNYYFVRGKKSKN